MRRRFGRSSGQLWRVSAMFMVTVGHLEAVIHGVHQFAAVYRGLSQITQKNGTEEIGLVAVWGGHLCSVEGWTVLAEKLAKWMGFWNWIWWRCQNFFFWIPFFVLIQGKGNNDPYFILFFCSFFFQIFLLIPNLKKKKNHMQNSVVLVV